MSRESVGIRSEFADEIGRTALVALQAADLPAPQHTARNSMVQVSFSRTYWQFVQVAQNHRMRNVLITDLLLGAKIKRVLRTEHVRLVTGERGIAAISIG